MNLADMVAMHMRPHPANTLRHTRMYRRNEVAEVGNDSKKLPDDQLGCRDDKGGGMVKNKDTAKRQYHPVVCRAVIKFHTEKFSCHIPFPLKQRLCNTTYYNGDYQKNKKNIKKI
jgi:hypothetical protein